MMSPFEIFPSGATATGYMLWFSIASEILDELPDPFSDRFTNTEFAFSMIFPKTGTLRNSAMITHVNLLTRKKSGPSQGVT
jgi:hypothetical protein